MKLTDKDINDLIVLNMELSPQADKIIRADHKIPDAAQVIQRMENYPKGPISDRGFEIPTEGSKWVEDQDTEDKL